MDNSQATEAQIILDSRARMRNTLKEWLRTPDKYLRGASDLDKAKFRANLVSALAFYEEKHHETHEQAKSSRTFR
jgi:hypothetical protein